MTVFGKIRASVFSRQLMGQSPDEITAAAMRAVATAIEEYDWDYAKEIADWLRDEATKR